MTTPYYRSSFRKTLTPTDVGSSGSHQFGVVVPRADVAWFPKLNETAFNPCVPLNVLDETGQSWSWRFIYYNGKVVGGSTRNEYRVTGLGEFFRKWQTKPGDVLELRELAQGHYLARWVPFGEPPEVEIAEDQAAEMAGKAHRGQGFQMQADARQAVEAHAQGLVAEHFDSLGWSVQDVSKYRPYDLLCTKASAALHVEAKGTTGEGQKILLTPGEVRHALEWHPNVALGVVANVLVRRAAGSSVTAMGGDLVVYQPWTLNKAALVPTGFKYTL